MMGEQLSETMVLILIAAALISAFLGKGTETAAILAIVVLFAVLGFVQEYGPSEPWLRSSSWPCLWCGCDARGRE